MDGQIGQDHVAAAAFEDTNGAITGKAANFTVTVTNRATGATVVSGAPTESPAGSGVYVFTINSTFLTGRMRLRVAYTNTVDELNAEFFAAIGDVPSWARTRRELRRRIAARLASTDDRVWQERAASGTTTTAVLSNLTVGGDNEYRGCWAWFGSGANAGKERRLTGFTAATSGLTWGPALGTAVAANDWVEIYPPHSRPSRLNDAIDDAIADLQGVALVDVDERVLATDGATTEWSLPSDARYIYRVGIVRDSDSRFLGWFAPGAWTLLPNRTLRLDEAPWQERADPLGWGPWLLGQTGYPSGYHLRTLLLCDVDPPLLDDSTVDIPPDAVVSMAAYRLALTRPDLKDLLPFWEREASAAKSRAATRLPGGAREVGR